MLNALVVLAILAVAGLSVIWTTRTGLLASIDQDMRNRARPMRQGMRGPGGPGGPGFRGGPPPEPDQRPRPPANDDLNRPRLFRQDGKDLDGRVPVSPDGLAALSSGHDDLRTIDRNGEPVRVFSFAIHDDGGQAVAGQLAYGLSDYYRVMDAQGSLLLTLTPFCLLLAGAAGWFLAGRALAPVVTLATTAESIDPDSMGTRISVKGSDEIARLGTKFNQMMDRLDIGFAERALLVVQLQDALDQQKRFVADASHELRTPLARIKLSTSSALGQSSSPEELREALAYADGGVDNVSALVNQLLALTRAESSDLELSQVDVGLVVAKAADLLPKEGPHLNLNVVHGLTVTGYEADLVRALRNLLENATHYSPAASPVDVTATADSGWVVVEVADRGPGVPESALSHLGERFYRVDDSRGRKQGGTGLGLAIARAIALRHGGSLSFRLREGGGLSACLKIPRAM